MRTAPIAPRSRAGDLLIGPALVWIGLAAALIAGGAVLNLASPAFAYERALEDMPALPLAAGLSAAGALYLCLVPLVRMSLSCGLGHNRKLLALVLVAGALMRITQFGAVPAFEDDWYRYLWDGGVLAHGFDPYEAAPADATAEVHHYTLRPLATEAGIVYQRINHGDVRTIYPPVAVAAFAAAHLIEPWSLEAWRLVVLAGELATVALLLGLLRATGRSPLWVALYWWNPIAVKELMNSAHMEAIVMPFVLGALLLALKRRHGAAAAALGFAIGAKIWPVLLVPLVVRPLLTQRPKLFASLAVLAALSALFAWPILANGLDATSGFTVYAEHWRNSSAHFAVLEKAVALVTGWSPESVWPGRLARTGLALMAGGVALAAAWRPITSAGEFLTRAAIVTGALFLLSPSQFPWYAVWVLPFAVHRPCLWLLALPLLMPLYYTSFYFDGLGAYAVYRDEIVWLLWLPVWSLLAWETSRVMNGRPLVAEAGLEHAHA